MPYPKEIATGESLIWLENSKALKEFVGCHTSKGRTCANPATDYRRGS